MYEREHGRPSSFRALALALAGSALIVPGVHAQQQSDPEVRNLIFMVADGAGVGTWTLARLARGSDLAVGRMGAIGLVDTRNVDGGLTDSAAGMTAYATGVRTFNRAIAVAPECRELMRSDSVDVNRRPEACAPLTTILERAESAGMATGLISTTEVIDATPASFVAHAPSRYLRAPIARQMADSGLEVLMGGGRGAFDGSRPDGAGDLLPEWCERATCPADAYELGRSLSEDKPLIGLFADEDMPRAGERSPDLPTMTRAALTRLGGDPDGFFLLVETEGTDSYQHDNDPADLIENEIVEFDRAVGEALAFAERVPGTLVVVTADHETGGLAVHGSSTGREREIRYTTGDHTHALVPLYAHGPGAERLAGVRDNDEVGRILRELLLGTP